MIFKKVVTGLLATVMVFSSMAFADTSRSSVKYITETIVVAAGTTYDGNGETIVAQGMGDGGQSEDQKPIFRLERGASLKNVVIGFPGCDGVHCYGDNIVENVIWEDIGEDALTVKGSKEYSDAGSINISNCQAYKGSDKVLQVNAPCELTAYNFTADTFGKFIRQNGGTDFTCKFVIDSCTLSNAKECIARTDSTTTQLYYRNLSLSNIPQMWLFPSESQIHAY